jgi:hypothetical protein
VGADRLVAAPRPEQLLDRTRLVDVDDDDRRALARDPCLEQGERHVEDGEPAGAKDRRDVFAFDRRIGEDDDVAPVALVELRQRGVHVGHAGRMYQDRAQVAPGSAARRQCCCPGKMKAPFGCWS